MKTVFETIRKYLPKAKKQFAAVIVYVLAITALEASLTVLMSRIISEAEIRGTIAFLLMALGGFLVLLLLDCLLSIGKYRAQDRLGGAFLEAMRTDMYQAVEKADYQSLISIGKDKLKHIFYSDVLDVFRIVGNYIGYILLNLVLLISFLIVSAFVNAKLAVFLLVAAIVGFAISWLSRRLIMKRSAGVNQMMKADHAELNDFVDSIELVKTHSLGDYFVERQKRSLWGFINASLDADAVMVGLNTLSTNYYQLIYLGVAAFLSMTVNGSDAGSLAFFLFATQKIISYSSNLETAVYMVMRMAPAFGNVNKIFETKQEDGDKEISGIDKIELKNVSFSYNGGDDYVIKNQSQVFEKGDIVRLSGANGSGKSTYVKLLVNLLKPTEGELLVNGMPAEEIRRESLYKHILYISQDEILLNDSAKNYIEEITGIKLSDGDFSNLLKQVDLPEDLPDIEMGGKNLSGGQRKKLMLINLILRWQGSSVIILDELENALDAGTREFAGELLDTIYKDRANHIIFRISHIDDGTVAVNKQISL